MKPKIEHRYAETESGSRIVDYDFYGANAAIDDLVSDIGGAEVPEREDDQELRIQQVDFGGRVRRLIGAPMGNPDVEMAYYSAYLLPRILRNLRDLEVGGDSVGEIRGVIGARLEAALGDVLSGEKAGSIGSSGELWKLYKVIFGEGLRLRKSLEKDGVGALVGFGGSQSEAKRVIKYGPEFSKIMMETAKGTGVNFSEVVGDHVRRIMADYRQHSEKSDLVLDPHNYASEMMRVFYEDCGYLEEFQQFDEGFFERFFSLRDGLQSLIEAYSAENSNNHREEIQHVLQVTLGIMNDLNQFYVNHVIHSGLMMNRGYQLTEKITAAGIASVKWHLLLAHFILTQKRLFSRQ